jgi:hypothetical protein
MFRRCVVAMLESIHLLNPRRGARDTNEIENENEPKAKLDALTKTRDKVRADLIEAYERANGRMYIIGDLEKAYTAACEALAAARLAEDEGAAAGRSVSPCNGVR